MIDNQINKINAELFLDWVKEHYPTELQQKVNAESFFLKALFQFIQEKNINPNQISVELSLNYIEKYQNDRRTSIPAEVGNTGYNETVANLMSRLEYVHKDLVVLFERLDDSYFKKDNGWKTYKFSWEAPIEVTPNKRKHLSSYLDNGDYYLKTINNKEYLIQEIEYISSFSSYVGINQKGQQAFCIHANY